MSTSDIAKVVDVHNIAFKGFFLTRMGPYFLRNYYAAALDFEANISLVACDQDTDEIVGFVVGFYDPEGFYSMLSKRRRQTIPAVLLAALRDPWLVPQILRNMRRVQAQGQQPVDAVELSSIAVGEPGRGAGGALLEAFAEKARSEGAHRLILTTDAEGNDLVRRFYEARGFTLDDYEDRGERRMCRYARSLG